MPHPTSIHKFANINRKDTWTSRSTSLPRTGSPVGNISGDLELIPTTCFWLLQVITNRQTLRMGLVLHTASTRQELLGAHSQLWNFDHKNPLN